MKKNNQTDIVKHEDRFEFIITFIDRARQKVYSYVNSELIDLYWKIGKYISETVPKHEQGKQLIKELSNSIQKRYAGIEGFSPSNLSRMRKFYEIYKDSGLFATVLQKLSWSHNVRIMSLDDPNEREYYLRTSIQNGYSFRELDRQIERHDFESRLVAGKVNKKAVAKHQSLDVFRDTYALEFLNLPENYKEVDLRRAIVNNLKKFILEFGRDFTFVGEEYPIQVGDSDFRIDLLFYHRVLKCLVAIELKSGKFKPEHLGQLNFYLEALDRQDKKPGENPSVGIILCGQKDDVVVEYAMASNLKPSLVAQYKLYLPSKEMLEAQAKLIAQLKDDVEE